MGSRSRFAVTRSRILPRRGSRVTTIKQWRMAIVTGIVHVRASRVSYLARGVVASGCTRGAGATRKVISPCRLRIISTACRLVISDTPLTAMTTSSTRRPALKPTVPSVILLMMGRQAPSSSSWAKADMSKPSSVRWKRTPIRSDSLSFFSVTSRNWIRPTCLRLGSGRLLLELSPSSFLPPFAFIGLMRTTLSLCAALPWSATSPKRTPSSTLPSTSTTLSPGLRMDAASEPFSTCRMRLVGSRVKPGEPLKRLMVRVYSLRRIWLLATSSRSLAFCSRGAGRWDFSREKTTVISWVSLGRITSLNMRPRSARPSTRTILSFF
mmetsp:Transcript_14526/g.44268  ORF Transcript_14526/g.44268 Transcript_14526/m.44268 type:complete len:324 (+) Transcript_14526:85-1056(+)